MSLPYGSSFCWCASRSSLQPPVSDRRTHGRKGDGFGALRAGKTRTSVAVTPKLLVFFTCCWYFFPAAAWLMFQGSVMVGGQNSINWT